MRHVRSSGKGAQSATQAFLLFWRVEKKVLFSPALQTPSRSLFKNRKRVVSFLYHFSPCCHFSLSTVTFDDQLRQKKFECMNYSTQQDEQLLHFNFFCWTLSWKVIIERLKWQQGLKWYNSLPSFTSRSSFVPPNEVFFNEFILCTMYGIDVYYSITSFFFWSKK